MTKYIPPTSNMSRQYLDSIIGLTYSSVVVTFWNFTDFINVKWNLVPHISMVTAQLEDKGRDGHSTRTHVQAFVELEKPVAATTLAKHLGCHMPNRREIEQLNKAESFRGKKWQREDGRAYCSDPRKRCDNSHHWVYCGITHTWIVGGDELQEMIAFHNTQNVFEMKEEKQRKSFLMWHDKELVEVLELGSEKLVPMTEDERRIAYIKDFKSLITYKNCLK